MRAKAWSIERRLVRWIAGSSLLMAALFGLGSAWFVITGLAEQLDLIEAEEVAELEADLRGHPLTRADLEQSLRAIADQHTDHRFSWRIWRPNDATPWLTLGSTPRTPLPNAADEARAHPRAPSRHSRWRVVDIPLTLRDDPTVDTLQVGMLLDSQPHRESALEQLALVIGIVWLTAFGTAVSGLVLARKVARTLRDATARARDLDGLGTTAELAPGDAPNEVVALAGAFRHSLAELREQYSRNLLLTAGMAHELRSPLQNMMGEASVALLKERAPSEYREVLESQLEEMRDLGRVVDNIITLTALREPGALARKERFQFGAEAELRLAKEALQAQKRGISFDIDRDGDLDFEGDREALMLALRNVVDNALRHAPDGGAVEVRMHGASDAVRITVDDDGPGVAVESRALIFEPFRQAMPQSKRRGGYGLGLALARAAATAHGGTIDVSESRLGGACFGLTLPRPRP